MERSERASKWRATKGGNMKTPSRKTGLLCLVIFVLALIGMFVPLGHLPYAGNVLGLVNHYHEWLLIAGYGLLLLSVYIL
jgi:hypothetical protein